MMNPSKIILVQPPIQDFYLTEKRTLPYGLASIAASVRQKGFDVEILDALATRKSKPIAFPENFSHLKAFYGRPDVSAFSLFHHFRHFGYSYEHLGTWVRKKKPLLVGISSLFTAYGNEAIQTALTIKKFYPDCKIVLGGHHPTVFPEKVLACPAIDFVLRGEGETSMGLLCEAVKNNAKVDHIPGIAFRTDTKIHLSLPSWIKDLGSLANPATDLIDHNFYQRKKRACAIVVSSRGCPMQCSYCSVSAASDAAPFRQRPVQKVITELADQAKARDIGFIDFEDENLCLNKAWFVRLFTGIKHLFAGKNVELRAMNGLYPPSIDVDIVRLMKGAGFKTLNLSLGSTSPDQLKKFRRKDVRASFERALDLARTFDLDCVSYLIAAAPGQSAQSSIKDLLYLARKRTLVGLSIYYPAPGSLDYKTCRDTHILPKSFSLMRSTALPLDHTTSRLQAVTLLRLSRILNFMKHLKDTQGVIPGPKAFCSSQDLSLSDRMATSGRLLQWFLHDAKIRGVQPDGEPYLHAIDENLAQQFVEQINTRTIKGVR